MDITTCSLLYKTYIRPVFEFAGPVWYPIYQYDGDLLESVQRFATRLPYGYLRPDYPTRLKIFSLPIVEDRRLRGDLIVTYRALRGHFGVDLSHMFPLNINNALRGHNFKLAKEVFRTTSRQKFLPNRVFSVWNSLPVEVVNASSVNSFKNRYDDWCALISRQ
ncbi:uncharacterized protein LOC123322409 [Coccinella septempunctata]|uniref:uncharacterized protein LOC123322409 n=1 Tax=Coccinella septempunctata TaxID=41139 RepID=UPI001D0807CA|nr:uncharacterized protein LOC123322409 [Coccinella septempunctata]